MNSTSCCKRCRRSVHTVAQNQRAWNVEVAWSVVVTSAQTAKKIVISGPVLPNLRVGVLTASTGLWCLQ